MANEINYVVNWKEEATQCKNCKYFQVKEGRNVCVPPGKNFEQAIEEFGEALPTSHCNYFEPR